MNATELFDAIAQAAHHHAVALVGVADMAPVRSRFGSFLLEPDPSLNRAVVMGIPLQQAVLDTLEGRPNPLYFHHYRQLNYQLDRVALVVAHLLQEHGWRSLAIAASQIVERKPMLGHLPHKLLGYFAGLGWMGRNNLLVNRRYGACVRYVTVLTDAPLEPGQPVDDDCGTCRACVAACPGEAIGDSFKTFDLEACTRTLDDYVRNHVVGQHICGVCVGACRGELGRELASNPAGDG
ncbi:MAG: hypothetical protein ACOCXX_05095 [Planctomycetota bacterium]